MTKRLLSMCLVLVLLLVLLPTEVFGAVITADVNTGYNTATGTPSQSGLFSTAYVRNSGSGSNGTARKIEAVVNLKSGGEPGQLVYAVVMLASEFNTRYSGAQLTGISNTTYANLPVTAAYYAIGAHSKGEGTTLTLPLVTANTTNAGILQTDGTVANKDMGRSPVGGKYYHEEYVLVVFAFDAEGIASRYYVDRFYMDAEGYVLAPSYGVRYNPNNPTINSGSNPVNSMPTNGNVDSAYNRVFIKRAAWNNSALGTGAPGDMTLSTAVPTRTGYEFVGWTDKALNPLGEGATVPDNGEQVTSGSNSATFYTKGGTYAQPGTLNQIYDLYALWRVVPVKFAHTVPAADTNKYTITNEGTEAAPNWVINWKTAPQVGVKLDSGAITYAQPANASSQPYGQKTFSVTTYQGSTQKSIANPYNGITVGRNSSNHQWGFAATTGPTNHTYKDDGTSETYSMVIKVTDPSNNTSDTITVRFPRIEKRAQNKPDLDVNTGLEGGVDTLSGATDEEKLPKAVEDKKLEELNEGGGTHTAADLYEFKDGKLTGFYATGQKEYKDNGGNTMNNGTGSLKDYYLNNGMIYEYRPYKDGADENDGWREIPYPETYYSGANKTTVTNAMGYRVKATAYTNARTGTIGVTSVKADTRDEPWPAEYGWITWENGLPVVHGLTEGTIYEVRFRSNTTSSASAPVQLAIVAGGAAAAVGGGGGLAVNLAGGTAAANPDAYADLRVAAAALRAGGRLDLNTYKFEPTREGGSEFLGWTLGERDADGNLILYRADEPKSLTVKWLDDNGDELATATIKEGDADPDYPGTLPTHDGYTFNEWTRSADADGNITFTATYTENPPAPEPGPEPETQADEGGETPEPGEGGETPEPGPDEPTPAGPKHLWVDGLTGETILEGDADTTPPAKPYHICYTAAEAWADSTDEDGTVTHTILYTRNTIVPMPDETPASMAAVWSGGSSDPSGFASVVLYDWDSSTVLGTLVVDKNDTAAAQRQIEEFTASLYPAGYDPETGLGGVLYNEDSPLTNKKGYSFGKWVNLDATHEDGSEVFTIYGDVILISNNTQKETLEEPPDIDFSDLANGLILKAVYKSNAEMTASTSALQREYVVSYDSFNRYADGDAYSIKVRVQREFDGTGIQRCRTPALRVVMSDGTNNIFMLVNIAISDDQIVEIAAPPTVKNAQITVIDIGGVSNWVNGTAVRSRTYTAEAGTTESQKGYVFEGNLAYINDILDSGEGTLGATHYSVAGLTVSRGNVAGTTSTAGGTLRTQALTNLRDAYAAKNANGTHVGLTWSEMDNAIKSRIMPDAVSG